MNRNKINKISLLITVFAFALSVPNAPAQGPTKRCSTQEPPLIQAAIAHAAVTSLGEVVAAQAIEVPVAFHIIQNSAGSNSATSEQLSQQIDQLNAAFGGGTHLLAKLS
jgi:hypothetical protein